MISYLYGINHETVSKQWFIFYFLYIPLHTTQEFLKYRSVNKYCKSFIHMSSTAPIAEWLERQAGKRGVAGSIPGGGINYHFEFPFNDSSSSKGATFIQSDGWTEIDLILKQIWRRFIWWQVSLK